MCVPHHFLPELLPLIFHDLSFDDLKSTRLVCRLFCIGASPYLITRVYLAPLTHVIDRFTAICAHPVFSRSVREIVYVDTVYKLDHVRGFAVFRNVVEQQAISWDRDRKIRLNKRRVKTSYANYRALALDQEDVVRDRRDLDALIEALPRLRNLMVLEITDLAPMSGLYGEGREAADMLVLPCRWDNSSVPEHMQGRGWAVCIQALAKTGIGVEGLRVNAMPSWKLNDAMPLRFIHPNAPEPLMENDLAAFRGFKRVDLQLMRDDDMDFKVADDGWLAKIMASAEELEELKLAMGIKQPFIEDVRMAALVGTEKTWPRLRSVDLKGFKCTEAELSDFLRRHASTLKHLALFKFEMTKGSLIRATESMASFMKLERFSMDYANDRWGRVLNPYRNSELKSQVENFVLGRISNPWPESFRREEERASI